MSARTSDANGPGKSRLRSRTRMPSRGFFISLVREELLQLHREHLVARDLQLAGEEELHAVGLRVLDELLEVVARDRDRAVGGTAARLARRARRRDVDVPLAFARDVHLVLRADRLRVVRVARERTRKVFVEKLFDVDGHAVLLAGAESESRFSCGVKAVAAGHRIWRARASLRTSLVVAKAGMTFA